MTAFTSNIEAITSVFDPLSGKSMLDIGCGRGRLSRALAKRGAVATGLEPQTKMIEIARETAPEATFVQGGAESLPFDDASFDGAVILNSLHHIPESLLYDALSEAMRVIKPGATFLILEPLARGGYQQVFAPIDDETAVRAMALEKLAGFIARTNANVVLRTEFDTLVPEESAESVLSGGVRVDPSRAALIEAKRAEVTALFEKHVQQTPRGPALDQPMIGIALQRPN